MLKITALMENRPSANRALINEHGLSLIIENNGHRILFDCGQSRHFIDNAHRLGISLSDLDAVVLSHGHYDHAAGFRDLIESGIDVPVLYIGKDFLDRKYSRKGMRFADLSPGWDEAFVLSHGVSLKIVDCYMEILPGIAAVSGFERIHNEEVIPDRFVRETAAGIIPDDFHDELVLCIDTDDGIVIIAGCSHPGVMNIFDTVRQRLGKRVYGIIGGMHLSESDAERSMRTFSYLHDSGVEAIAPCHCSGEMALEIASSLFGDKAAGLSAGESLFF